MSTRTLSPLRYPGGKSCLTNYMKVLIKQNYLEGCKYIEPFAGGAGLALNLLNDGYVSEVHINDLDRSIYSFWWSILNRTDSFIRRIETVEINMKEYWHQKEVQKNKRNATLLELGFSTFFLNRVNRSGIITAGVIGGNAQNGKYKMNVRFNKTKLIDKIRKIKSFRNRITLSNIDAKDLIDGINPNERISTIVYVDPPYYVKGSTLYQNFFNFADHRGLRDSIFGLRTNWIVSYDNVSAIQSLYEDYNSLEYGLNYSANNHITGSEIIFFSQGLNYPTISPTKIEIKL